MVKAMKNSILSKGFLSLVLFLLIFDSHVIAKEIVAIKCPCTFERINDTKANISLSISYLDQINLDHDMTIYLVGRETQASHTYYILGQAPLAGIAYSADPVPLTIKMPLNGIPKSEYFLDLLLKASNGDVLDTVYLTENTIDYQNYGANYTTDNRIFFDASVDFSYTENTFNLSVPMISSNILKSTSEQINVVLKVIHELTFFEKTNLSYTINYDEKGIGEISIEGDLDRALDSHLWHDPDHTDVFLELWKNNELVVKTLIESLVDEMIPSRQFSLNNVDTLIDSDLDGISDFNERLLNTNPQIHTNFSSRTVEIAFTTGSVVTGKYSNAEIEAIIAHWVAVTNQAFKDSGLNFTIENVGQIDLGNDLNLFDANINTALNQRMGIFSSLDERLSRKPDLIIHLTTLDRMLNTSGRATLQGAFSDGVIGYSTAFSDATNTGVVALDSTPLVLAHELGHLMGLSHSKRNSSRYGGSFTWSNGYGVDNEFTTIMSYEESFNNAPKTGLFSSPKLQCGPFSEPCGVARQNLWDGADNTLTLNTTAIQIGAIANGFGPNIDLVNAGPFIYQNIDQVEAFVMSAIDAEDGDITQSIIQTTYEMDVFEKHDYERVFSVIDSDGNRTEQTVDIFIDNIPPVITLNGDSFLTLYQGESYTDQGATVADNLDESVAISSYGSVDTSTPGLYTLTYKATDQAGNLSEVKRNIEVLRNQPNPAITWDIDKNGKVDALTDGLLLIRYLFGLRGSGLVSGAIATDATILTEDIELIMEQTNSFADIDNNGLVDALTDGLLLIRYLFGLRGDMLVRSAISTDAVRSSEADIEAYIESHML